jgi:hypothetical protein
VKVYVFTVALAVALAVTGPAFAEDVTKAATKAGCEKAGGMWDAQSYKCAEDSAKMGKAEGTHEHSQSTPEHDTQKIDQPERRNPTTGN